MTRLAIHDSTQKWPFPLVTDLRHQGSRDWVEIGQKDADYFLEVLPPIYFKGGGFFVSEAAAHVTIDGREVPVYAAVVQRGSRYFMREFPRTASEIVSARVELDMALGIDTIQPEAVA